MKYVLMKLPPTHEEDIMDVDWNCNKGGYGIGTNEYPFLLGDQ